MKQFALWSILLTIIVGCQGTQSSEKVETKTPIKISQVMLVPLARPVVTSGVVSSESQVKLSFKIAGILAHLNVQEGVNVRKGDILASLKLDEIKGQVEQARSGYEKADRDHKRIRNLYQEGATTLAQFQDAETGLAVAKSQLQIAEFNLEHAVIKAPADGYILKQYAEENELVGSGQPVYLFGMTPKEWVIHVGIIDRQVAEIKIGDSADVVFDAIPGKTYSAIVREIAGAPEPGIGTYDVQLSLGEKTNTIRNGFIADVTIYPSQKSQYWLVPVESVVDADGPDGFVFSVTSDSLAKKLPVTLEFIHGKQIAVSTGLDKVDQVVTDGASYLKDGTPVQIIAD